MVLYFCRIFGTSPLSRSPDKPHRSWAELKQRQCQWDSMSASAVDQGRFLSKSDLWLSLHRSHVLHQFLQAPIFLLTHNVRWQKCEIESITSFWKYHFCFFSSGLFYFASACHILWEICATSGHWYLLIPYFLFCPASPLSHEQFKAEITGGLKTSAA